PTPVEVVADILHVIRDGLVINLHAAQKKRPVQRAALVPSVVKTDPEGVFIQIIGTLVVDMPLSGLECGLHFPHAVQLPPLAGGIDVVLEKLLLLATLEIE